VFATGHILYQRNGVLDELCAQAAEWLDRPANLTSQALTFLRYTAALQYEDALDRVDDDPATAGMLLSQAVLSMLRYGFAHAGHNEPRPKELLTGYAAVDSAIAALAQQFYETGPLPDRLSLARQIAAGTIGVEGFFAWMSDPEAID